MENPHTSSAPGALALAPLVAPTVQVSSPPSGIAGTTVTLAGTGFTGVLSVTFGGVSATAFTVFSSTKITAVAPPGSGTVQIVVTTTGGTSNGIDFTYTTPTPVLNSLTPASGPVSGGNSVTLTGSGLSGTTGVKFGAVNVPFTVVSANQITAIAPAAAGPGSVNVSVTTPGGTSNTLPYTYVNAPVLTSVTPNQGSNAGGTVVTLTGTGLSGATSVTFGGVPATSFTVLSNTQITAVTPGGITGTVPVAVTTAAGTASGVNFYFLPPPILTSAAPGSGPTTGGTTVVLTGSGLATATNVLFGGTPANSFTVVSDSQINAVAPAKPAGTVSVTVVTPGGTSNGTGYTYVVPPVLASLAPNIGPTAGGNTVTLSGSGLTTASSVLFGGVPVPFTVLSDTTVTAIASPAAAGTVLVTVVTPGGTTAGVPYTRVPPPGI